MIHRNTKEAYHQKKAVTSAAKQRKTGEKKEKPKTYRSPMGVSSVMPTVIKPLIKRK